MQDGPDKATAEVTLWDPLLRIFHWLLALSVLVSLGTGKFGPSIMTLHFWAGYAVIGLLAFRLIWGFFGPASARFTHFIYGPRAIFNYIKTLPKPRPSYWRGHNPTGGAFVIGLLLILMLQAASGLIADPEDYINVGPLAYLTDTQTNRDALALHHRLAIIIVVLVALHIAVIIFYKLYKKENLIKPMITGKKTVYKD